MANLGTPVGYGGGGGGSPPSSIIFRPGGVAAGNVFVTAATVAAALAAVGGAADVYIDDSLGAPTIPNGVTWNFQGFGSIYGDLKTFPSLDILDGGQILNPGPVAQNLNVRCHAVTKRSLDFSDWSEGPTIALDYCTLTLDASCTLPPILVPAAADFFFVLQSSSSVDVSAAPAVGAIELGAGASVFPIIFQSTIVPPVPASLVKGGVGTTLQYTGDSSAFPVPIWTLFVGTLVIATTDNYPWSEDGTPGGVLAAADITAALEQGGGSATGARSVAFRGSAGDVSAFACNASSIANGINSFCAAEGNTTGASSSALSGGVGSGTFSVGICNGTAHSTNDFAAGTSASATGGDSVAFAFSTAGGSSSFACGGSDATASFSFAASAGVAQNNGAVALIGATALGQNSFGTNGANVSGLNSAGIGPITTTADAQWAIGSDTGPSTFWNVDTAGTIEHFTPVGATGHVFIQDIAPGVQAQMMFGFDGSGNNFLNFGQVGSPLGILITNVNSPGAGNNAGPMTLRAQDGDGATNTNGGDLHLSPGGPGSGGGATGHLFFDNVPVGAGGAFALYSGTFSVSLPGVGLVQIPFL